MLSEACIVIACTTFISDSQTIKPRKSQIEQCVKVMNEADEQGVDLEIAAAVAWKESRFKENQISEKGAVGVMQIIPRYWCPNKRRCDSIKYGILALVKLKRLYGIRDYLCRYASGKSCKLIAANRYKQSVKRIARRFQRSIKGSCVDGC